MRQFNNYAFTLIELLLVLAIISLLSISAGPSLTKLMIKNNLETSRDKILGTIRKAQINSMNNKSDTAWGFCIFSDKLRLYSGTCNNPSYFEDMDLRGVNISGLNDTSFSGIYGRRGEPSGTLNISISNAAGSVGITLNSAGGLEVY